VTQTTSALIRQFRKLNLKLLCCQIMFTNIDAFGWQLLISIYLILCSIVASKICFGSDRKRSKEIFVFLFLFLLVGIQYFYLLDVATFIPATRFYTYDVSLCLLLFISLIFEQENLKRNDCLESNKGGKRVKDGNETYDINPCFCNSAVAKCYSKSTGTFRWFSMCFIS
jgi:hypothetical protein